MICIGLPLFSGDLQDDYLAFEERFLAWMRFHSPAHGFSELNRTDLLQLAMVPNSAAHAFYAALEGGFGDRLAALHQHFGSDTRVKSKQLSALNKLALRSFRDGGSNKSEMVDSLLTDLSRLFLSAGILDDADKRTYLCRAFKDFPVCLKLVKEAATFDEAVLESLKWEQLVVKRALHTASQASSAEDKARARMSIIQKIDTWRGSQDSLVDPPSKRISQAPTSSLPLPQSPEELHRNQPTYEPRWRHSTAPSSPALSISSPRAADFDKTALPTPSKAQEDLSPSSQASSTRVTLHSTLLDEVPSTLSPSSTTSVSSQQTKDTQPTTLQSWPGSLPANHPYFRVQPILVPEEFRQNIKLAMTDTNSTYEPSSSDAESLVEDFEWSGPASVPIPSVRAKKSTPRAPRRLRRKSETSALDRKLSLSSSRTSTDAGGKLPGFAVRGFQSIFRGNSTRSTDALGQY